MYVGDLDSRLALHRRPLRKLRRNDDRKSYRGTDYLPRKYHPKYDEPEAPYLGGWYNDYMGVGQPPLMAANSRTERALVYWTLVLLAMLAGVGLLVATVAVTGTDVLRRAHTGEDWVLAAVVGGVVLMLLAGAYLAVYAIYFRAFRPIAKGAWGH